MALGDFSEASYLPSTVPETQAALDAHFYGSDPLLLVAIPLFGQLGNLFFLTLHSIALRFDDFEILIEHHLTLRNLLCRYLVLRR